MNLRQDKDAPVLSAAFPFLPFLPWNILVGVNLFDRYIIHGGEVFKFISSNGFIAFLVEKCLLEELVFRHPPNCVPGIGRDHPRIRDHENPDVAVIVLFLVEQGPADVTAVFGEGASNTLMCFDVVFQATKDDIPAGIALVLRAIIQGLLHRSALFLAQGAFTKDSNGVGPQLFAEIDFPPKARFTILISRRPFFYPFPRENSGTVFEDLPIFLTG